MRSHCRYRYYYALDTVASTTLLYISPCLGCRVEITAERNQSRCVNVEKFADSVGAATRVAFIIISAFLDQFHSRKMTDAARGRDPAIYHE